MERNAHRTVTSDVQKHTESDDTEKLRFTKGQNYAEQTFFCEYCFATCFQNAGGTKHYCSNACKQRALRARQGRGWQDDDNRELAAIKALETKRNQLVSRTCLQCGMYFHINGLQHKKRFCSAACKVAYHRRWQRLEAKWRSPGENNPVRPIPLTDDEKIRQAWSSALDENTEISNGEGSNFNEND